MRHVVGALGNPGAIAVTSWSKREVWWYPPDAISEGGGLLFIFVVTSIKAHVVGVACCAILGQSGKHV